MSSDLPIVENAYRDFLSSEHKIFKWFLENSEEHAQIQYGLESMPEQTAIPGALPWSFVMNLQMLKHEAGYLSEELLRETQEQIDIMVEHDSGALVDAYLDVYGANLPDDIDNFWFRQLFYANYRETRQTYHVKPALWEQLEELELPEDAPAKTLEYLPLPAFGLRSPDGTIFTVCYDLLSGEEGSGELELRVGRLHKDRSIEGFTLLHLGAPGKENLTIKEGFRRGIETIAEGMQGRGASGYITTGGKRYTIEEFRDYMYQNARRIISVLLYLAGEDDIVDRVGHYPPPFKRHKRSLEDTSYEEDLEEEPEEADVGVRMQQAFKQYKEGREEESAEGEGPKKKPHVRRPHPHLYWTGKGREIPKVKYLGPITVNAPDEDDDEDSPPPTVQDVK